MSHFSYTNHHDESLNVQIPEINDIICQLLNVFLFVCVCVSFWLVSPEQTFQSCTRVSRGDVREWLSENTDILNRQKKKSK